MSNHRCSDNHRITGRKTLTGFFCGNCARPNSRPHLYELSFCRSQSWCRFTEKYADITAETIGWTSRQTSRAVTAFAAAMSAYGLLLSLVPPRPRTLPPSPSTITLVLVQRRSLASHRESRMRISVHPAVCRHLDNTRPMHREDAKMEQNVPLQQLSLIHI